MEQLWLFLSLLSIVTGFGLVVALILLKRLAPINLPPIITTVVALLLMGINSFWGIYLRLISVPRSILPYRLLNAAAWGFAAYVLLNYLIHEKFPKRDAIPKSAVGSGILVFALSLLSAHPPGEGLLSSIGETISMILVELFIGVLALLLGLRVLARSRRVKSRPWRAFLRGYGFALLILIPANLLDFAVSIALRTTGVAARDGFIFAAGYGIANIILIIAVAGGIRLSNAEDVPAVAQQFVDAFGISKREREITEKLLEGKTDREIAEELYISPRTVDSHLRTIYRKCGVNSRLRLTRLVSDYGEFRNSP